MAVLNLILCDLDGVIFDHSGRDHLIPAAENISDNKAWEDHQSCTAVDPVIWHNVSLIKQMASHPDTQLVFFTSRLENCAGYDTKAALTLLGLLPDGDHMRLFMRPATNNYPPAKFKAFQAMEIVQEFNVLCNIGTVTVIEDTVDNLKAIRNIDLGFPTTYIHMIHKWD